MRPGQARLPLIPLFAILLAAALPAREAPAAGPPAGPADLVLRNGTLFTVDEATPLATALAARDGVIVALGSDDQVSPLIGPDTEVIDLAGALAIPGFIEGHGHFLGLGDALLNLRLAGAAGWDEIVHQVQVAVSDAAAGVWIRGRGWHQEKWDRVPADAVEGMPTQASLSAVSPDNPVMLRHASGHAALVNRKAMQLSGIDRETPDPPGGTIVRDADGEPTGVLRETAMGLVQVPDQWVESRERRKVALATRESLSKGVTSFQDAGSTFREIDLLKAMAQAGELDIRLWVMIRDSLDAMRDRLPLYRMENVGDHRLTVRAIKRSIDGALGPHGAWLLEPYSDKPDSTGLNITPVEEIATIAGLALEHRFQLCVHAIGDRANRETLDLFEQAFAGRPDGPDLRWRVEHAQHLHPDDIPRFATLGAIASMQSVHCTSDGPWVEPRLGPERARQGAYVWRKLLDAGAVVTNGTDAPVEDVDPLASFHAAVTRMMAGGEAFYPEQVMTREEALRSYTLDAAYAAFEEDIKGSLTVGKLADVTVLSRDIMTIDPDDIPGTEVLYTIVGGEVKYRRP